MFTIPVTSGSGIILVARPSASSGTITNPTLAYDLPSSRPDDPPYTTSADRATVSGSATPGTVDYDVVEFNTFPSRSKTNFSQCQLVVGMKASISSTLISYIKTGFTQYDATFVTASLWVDYQYDGSTWNTLRLLTTNAEGSLGVAANANTFNVTDGDSPVTVPGSVLTTVVPTFTIGTTIPSGLFPSNLNSLKIRFRLGTCSNNGTPAYVSSVSYSIWDIRANIS